MWNCLPSPLLPILCLNSERWSAQLHPVLGTNALADHIPEHRSSHVSFSLQPGLFIYFTCNEKPLFLFRNVLPILLDPDFVHSCLGASKTTL